MLLNGAKTDRVTILRDALSLRTSIVVPNYHKFRVETVVEKYRYFVAGMNQLSHAYF